MQAFYDICHAKIMTIEHVFYLAAAWRIAPDCMIVYVFLLASATKQYNHVILSLQQVSISVVIETMALDRAMSGAR